MIISSDRPQRRPALVLSARMNAAGRDGIAVALWEDIRTTDSQCVRSENYLEHPENRPLGRQILCQ
jgi:hypothetical protein